MRATVTYNSADLLLEFVVLVMVCFIGFLVYYCLRHPQEQIKHENQIKIKPNATFWSSYYYPPVGAKCIGYFIKILSQY